jgi:hypothetical protein
VAAVLDSKPTFGIRNPPPQVHFDGENGLVEAVDVYCKYGARKNLRQ